MIEVFSCSEAGGHSENEDAFLATPHPDDQSCYLCALADGQGGRYGGGLAAREACRASIEIASSCTPEKLLLPAAWFPIFHAADRALMENPEAGFTTLVALFVSPRYVCGASCGDSAAVVIDRQTPGEILTADQPKNPPVGSGKATFASFARKLEAPWALLLMSDGVWKYSGFENVLNFDLTLPVQKSADLLLNRARLAHSRRLQDDFTLLVLLDSIT